MKPLFEVKNLTIAFKTHGHDLHAVRGISFFLHEGESLGIVGESGCGKSTAAKALLKLYPTGTSTATGELLYDQQNLMDLSESQMQKIRGNQISMIFQDPLSFLNPTQKMSLQIMEGFFRHFKTVSRKEGRIAACQLLQELGFAQPEEVLEAYPHTLSGGMRQRVMVALALICQPKILLADEPASSLDSAMRDQMLSLLKRLQIQKKMSILLITHDMSIAAKFCDRILVMYAGKIVESGPADAIFRCPQHPYTEKLIQSIPGMDYPKQHPLITIEGAPPSLRLPLEHCGFCTRCPTAMNICAEASPPLYQTSDQHWSACFKHDKRCQI